MSGGNDCGNNIYGNSSTGDTYSAISLGSGEDIYAGDNVVGSNTEFQFKSIVAGANVTLSSTGSELTITSAGPDGGVTLLNQVGGGSEVAQNITGATLNLRTITGTGAATVIQNANTVQINSNAPTTVTNVGIGTAQVGNGIVGNALQLKTISASNGTAVSQSVDTIFITNNMVVSNNGGGQGLLINNIGGILNAKTLVAGTNVSLSSTANTVTVNSTASGITTLSNNGTGSAVGQSIVGNTLNLRTLIGTNGNSINASGNEVTIANDQIQSINQTLLYNYGQAMNNIDLGLSYNSPTGLLLNTVPAPENVSGTITGIGPASVTYLPGPRWPFATFLPFNTDANNGTTNASFVKVSPNTQYTNDGTQDYILGLATDNNVYQLNLNTFTETQMIKYDSSPLVLSPTPTLIAMDVEDNILFFANNEDVYMYDYALDLITPLFNVSNFVGFAGNLRYMYYEKSTLYFLDKNYTFWLVPVKPYDRYQNVNLCYGTAIGYPYSFPGDMFSFSIVPESGLPVITNVNGTTRISAGSLIGATNTGTEFQFNLVENNSSLYLTIPAASGRLYVFSPDNLKFYRFNYGESIQTGISGLFGTVNNYLSLTRSPYGVLA